jgi:hypothetical protein
MGTKIWLLFHSRRKRDRGLKLRTHIKPNYISSVVGVVVWFGPLVVALAAEIFRDFSGFLPPCYNSCGKHSNNQASTRSERYNGEDEPTYVNIDGSFAVPIPLSGNKSCARKIGSNPGQKSLGLRTCLPP